MLDRQPVWALIGIVLVFVLLPLAVREYRNANVVNAQTVYDAQCLADNALVIDQDGAVFDGITVRNSRQEAIQVNADNVTITNATIENWNCEGNPDAGAFEAGIACWHCSSLTVTDSTLNSMGKKTGNGIWLKSTTALPSSGGHLIARNTIIGGWDGIGSEAEDDVNGGFRNDSIIEHNIISGCDDDGIQMEGRDQNIIVRFNEVFECDTGIAFAPNLVGPLHIEDNYLHDSVAGFYGAQACFKVGDGGNGTTYLTRNRCEGFLTGVKQTNAGLSPIISRDNCLQVVDRVIETSDNPSGWDFDNDRLWTTGTNFIKWWGDSYTNLSSFQTATGQELNGEEVQGCVVTPTPTPTPIGPTATSTVTNTPTPTVVPSATPTPTPVNNKCRVNDRNNADSGWAYIQGTWKPYTGEGGGWVCVVNSYD